jgi:tetratricopeptide (TPR) repeat protein
LKPQLEDGMQGEIHDVAVMRRKYDDAIPMLQSLLDQKAEGVQAGFLHASLGHLHALSGDAGKAKESFDRAKAILLAAIASEPNNRYAMLTLATAYCYAGDRDLALKYADMAIRLTPSSKDAYSGPIFEDNRARIWATFGERDRAIPEIARLLKTTYAGPLTPAWLRLDPAFDKLRGDPRFEALLK